MREMALMACETGVPGTSAPAGAARPVLCAASGVRGLWGAAPSGSPVRNDGASSSDRSSISPSPRTIVS